MEHVKLFILAYSTLLFSFPQHEGTWRQGTRLSTHRTHTQPLPLTHTTNHTCTQRERECKYTPILQNGPSKIFFHKYWTGMLVQSPHCCTTFRYPGLFLTLTVYVTSWGRIFIIDSVDYESRIVKLQKHWCLIVKQCKNGSDRLLGSRVMGFPLQLRQDGLNNSSVGSLVPRLSSHVNKKSKGKGRTW